MSRLDDNITALVIVLLNDVAMPGCVKEDVSSLLVGAATACVYANLSMSYVEWSGSRFSSESWCVIGVFQLLMSLVIYFWSVFMSEPVHSTSLRVLMVIIFVEFILNEVHAAGGNGPDANMFSGILDLCAMATTIAYVLRTMWLQQPSTQSMSLDDVS